MQRARILSHSASDSIQDFMDCIRSTRIGFCFPWPEPQVGSGSRQVAGQGSLFVPLFLSAAFAPVFSFLSGGTVDQNSWFLYLQSSSNAI